MGRATIVTTTGKTRELTRRPSLTEAQQIVGGPIELVKARDHWGNSVTLVVNEEGKLKNLPTNNSITLMYGSSIYGGHIVGDVIILEEWRTVG